MSYLPQLRESLVNAAARHTEITGPAATRTRTRGPRRTRPFGALALMGASLAALVVAGVVLVLVGHRGTRPPAPATPVPTTPGAAAAQLLSEFRPPAGAVLIRTDPTRPRQLGAPAQVVPVAGGVDLYRLYRLTGDPQKIVTQIGNTATLMREQAPNGSTLGSGSGAPGGGSIASDVFLLGMRGGLARSFQARAVSLAHGAVALRIDAEAWWPVPRPASERIPGHVDAVTVTVMGQRPSPRFRPPRQLTGADAAETVALLNSLGIQQPHSQPCEDPSNFRIRLSFVRAGAVATIRPGCNTADLSLDGRAQPQLTFESSASSLDLLRYIRFMEMIEGIPRSRSLRDALTLMTTKGSSSSSSSAQGAISTPAKAP